MLNATATHDTKRGEDVRARINVLSEIPVEWKEHLVRWCKYAQKLKKIVGSEPVPDSNDEYMLYQTLIGAWPPIEMDKEGYEIFNGRIMEYARKAAREAKVNTSWMSPNEAYEEGLLSFISAILQQTPGNLFLKDFRKFQKKISHYGMYNSLSQTLLKIASPGVPDFYQGTELWDFRLVDPDNRRPVDYEMRIKMLAEIKGRESAEGPLKIIAELMEKWQDGRIKMFLIYKALQFRGANQLIFENGEYLVIEAKGQKAANVCAFALRSESMTVLVITPRFLTELAPMIGQRQFNDEVWADTHVVVPIDEAGTKYRNVFTGEGVTAINHDGQTGLRLAEVFRYFPVALLVTTQETS
jgi:(1->4)-alpha-D-glucan 1-alpha-D-glucosylmutase